MKQNDFGYLLTRFLAEYLPGQRGASPNTIKAYRDTFILFLRYCRDSRGWSLEKMQFKDVDQAIIVEFLEFLRQERQCGTRTCNHRLAALHSFFRYAQTEAPESLFQVQQILAIPYRRVESPARNYLGQDDLKAILAQPDLSTPTGRRDAVLLSLLYDSGSRVQEFIDLRVGDVRLVTPAHIRLTGKGRKTRLVPLMTKMATLLDEYLRERAVLTPEHRDEPLFVNRAGTPLSRAGVRYILLKYVEMTKGKGSFQSHHITPHTLRHSKAMHLLECDTPIVVIRDFLGHVDVRTTELYARANLEMKRKALEKAAASAPTPDASGVLWQKDKGILEWLESL